MAEKLMFIKDVAERLGRTEAQCRWMLHNHVLPKPAKISGRLVWKESQIEGFIDEAFAEAERSTAPASA